MLKTVTNCHVWDRDLQNQTDKNYHDTFTLNPFSANFTKWSNTLKQFIGNLPRNCLNVFDHFVGFGLEGLNVALLPILSTQILMGKLSESK